eukprot:TRINITY_DN4523_c0_g5_i1.p1 TRINITY_DN4523_c0_g5~~TRINITY_DN4523_c0_g5_i1.p1  ORF type:complete len:573 (+),score=195.67 TRINITY_DN4523_c0_g5_i1:154-1872(+)
MTSARGLLPAVLAAALCAPAAAAAAARPWAVVGAAATSPTSQTCGKPFAFAFDGGSNVTVLASQNCVTAYDAASDVRRPALVGSARVEEILQGVPVAGPAAIVNVVAGDEDHLWYVLLNIGPAGAFQAPALAVLKLAPEGGPRARRGRAFARVAFLDFGDDVEAAAPPEPSAAPSAGMCGAPGVLYVLHLSLLAAIDVSDPSAPKLAELHPLEWAAAPEEGAAGDGGNATVQGRDVLHEAGVLYVVVSDGLMVYDAGDPAALVRVGDAQVAASGGSRPLALGGVQVRGGWAYVASLDGLFVFDVAAPGRPVLASRPPQQHQNAPSGVLPLHLLLDGGRAYVRHTLPLGQIGFMSQLAVYDVAGAASSTVGVVRPWAFNANFAVALHGGLLFCGDQRRDGSYWFEIVTNRPERLPLTPGPLTPDPPTPTPPPPTPPPPSPRPVTAAVAPPAPAPCGRGCAEALSAGAAGALLLGTAVLLRLLWLRVSLRRRRRRGVEAAALVATLAESAQGTSASSGLQLHDPPGRSGAASPQGVYKTAVSTPQSLLPQKRALSLTPPKPAPAAPPVRIPVVQ